MGSKYRYECLGCGYSAVVGGGPDTGFVVTVQTGFCGECDELVDFVTEVWSPDGETEKGVVVGACFACGNQVKQAWNDGDRCPKCGGEFGEREFVMQWI